MSAKTTDEALPATPLSQMLQDDPLARTLHKWSVTPFRLALVVLSYGLLYTFGLPALWGTLNQALADWPSLVIVLAVSPLAVAYYAWQPHTIQNLYDGMVQRVRREDFNPARIEGLLRWYGMPVWFWIAFFTGLGQSIYIYSYYLTLHPIWQNVNPLMIAALVPLRFISSFGLMYVLIRKIITILLINRFFKLYKVDIAPLHPDKAGGLKLLGNYVLSTGYIIGLIGLLFGMTWLRIRMGVEPFTIEIIIDLVVYALAAPTLFLLPLWEAHTRMVSARQRIIADVAEELEDQFFASMDNLRQENLSSADADRLNALRDLYDLADKIPEWPLDFKIVSQFGAAVSLPVIVPIVLEIIATQLLGR